MGSGILLAMLFPAIHAWLIRPGEGEWTMEKQPIRLFDFWQETMSALVRDGLLLCSVGRDGQPNVMTIGWMTGGVVWGKPILVVFVRPTRYTYSRLEEVGEFTVNVLPPEFHEVVQFCGNVTGREVDKFAQTGLTVAPARKVRVPIIGQGVVHYECRLVHKNDVVPENLSEDIVASSYPQGNFHRIYFGEVVAAYAASDARERLTKALL